MYASARISSLHRFCDIIISCLTCPLAAFTHFASCQILLGSFPLPTHEAPAQTALTSFWPLLLIRYEGRGGIFNVLASLLGPEVPSSSGSPGVEGSPFLKEKGPLYDPNLLELDLRVISFWMKFSLDGVVSTGMPPLCPEAVRSRDSRDSVVEPFVARDCVSFDLRESGGDASSGPSSGVPFSPAFSLAFSLFLSALRAKNCVVKDGAAGLSFGVSGRWDDDGRVPIGAWSGSVFRGRVLRNPHLYGRPAKHCW